MTTIAAIVAAIVAALKADHGGGYNLAGTDAVKEGTWSGPPGSTAFAAVVPPEQTGGEEQARGQIVLETHETEIRAWAPYTAEDTSLRAIAARTLADLLKGALDDARLDQGAGATALGRCTSCLVTRVVADPAGGSAGPSWVHVRLTLTTTHRRAR